MIAGKNSISQGMLEEFERELVATRKFLERVPDGKLSWRPHAKSMSVGQLGLHIAETPGMSLRMVLPDRGSVPDFRERQEAATAGEMLAALEASAAFVREALPTVDDARMQELFAIDLPDGSSVELPRSRFIRTITLNHWYHHRGQLGVYLRLLGVSVPASYGPSGDEAGGI